ncbi:MAG: hypothetical protein Q9M13_06510 [Mariprofundales bacterium]|nr:hypothetical protein [Mariprofundales bacterium]
MFMMVVVDYCSLSGHGVDAVVQVVPGLFEFQEKMRRVLEADEHF